MRVQLHLKCVGEEEEEVGEEEEEEGRGFAAGESHSESGNKENKHEEINMRETKWVGRQRERATGVKMRFQY